MTDYDYTFKIMMLGDPSVNKASLTIRYISGFFLEDLKLTIGVDFYSKTTYFQGNKVKLQIWDFGGEERFRFLLHQYCKGSNAALFLYDITNRLTLEHLPDWIQIIREHSGDIPIILVGTKLHLQTDREVTREEGILIAENYNLSAFAEVSAETGQNVDRLFEDTTEILLERYVESQKLENSSKPIKSPQLKINDYIILKLENGKTNIYVGGKLFHQCKYLLLNIPINKIRDYDDIESIDEAATKLDSSMERGGRDKYKISPETEFWGHCSNIQAWYENNYVTNLLHSNLAFPLLKALVKAGDPLAKRVFKEEIAIRFESGYPSVIIYLIKQGYLDYLNEEELNILFESSKFIENLPRWFFEKNIPKKLIKKIKAKLDDFNTRLLDGDVAFPLLEALTKAGHPLAKKVFNELIAQRFESGYPSTVLFLINQGYLEDLNSEEWDAVIGSTKFLNNFPKWFFNINIPKWLFEKLREIIYDLNCPYCGTKLIESLTRKVPFKGISIRCEYCYTSLTRIT
ncbi:MAG: Rab family GTPase [Promethearchaeota archaeon]